MIYKILYKYIYTHVCIIYKTVSLCNSSYINKPFQNIFTQIIFNLSCKIDIIKQATNPITNPKFTQVKCLLLF